MSGPLRLAAGSTTALRYGRGVRRDLTLLEIDGKLFQELRTHGCVRSQYFTILGGCTASTFTADQVHLEVVTAVQAARRRLLAATPSQWRGTSMASEAV